MSIRDNVIDKITRELCIDWEYRLHTNGVSYNSLEVYADGSLVEHDEPSSNSWFPGSYTLVHTWGFPCNCDWCDEWLHNKNNVQDEFDDKDDYIQACLENCDDGGLEDAIRDKVREIPYGFFDDEKGEE